MEIDSMTQTELASYLETLAKLVEATAKDAQDAARIIRNLPKHREPKTEHRAAWPATCRPQCNTIGRGMQGR